MAVFGATARKESINHLLFRNVIDSFDGRIYPINPNEKEIMGHKVYGSILEVEGDVDLALISIPAERVLAALKDCAEKGVKACIILSAGFGELGNENRRVLQEKIREIAEECGMRVLGPNCMGVVDTNSKLNASYFRVPMEGGNVAFISQSGAFGGIVFNYSKRSLLKLSRFVSVGNMADVDLVEMMEYIGADENTEVVMLLIEGLRDGKGFLEKARRLSAEKPVLVYKIGRTEAGRRAARSHTGAMAGRFRVFEGACKQSGVLLFKDAERMMDAAQTFASQPLPSSPTVAIVTVSGGPGVAVSDLCNELGIQLPELDHETKERLKAITSPLASISNPLDMTPATPFSSYGECVETVMALDYIGGVIAINIGLDSSEFAEAFVKAREKYHKPIVACVIDAPSTEKIFREGGIPVLESPERCAFAFKCLVIRSEMRSGSSMGVCD